MKDGPTPTVSIIMMRRFATIEARAALEKLRYLAGLHSPTADLSGAVAVDGGTWVFVPDAKPG